VLVISLNVVMVVAWLLLLSQDVELQRRLLRGCLGIPTTGLSLGITGQLDTFGRLLIIATMFWGRLGAITIMLALLKHGTRQSLVKYPEETKWWGEAPTCVNQGAVNHDIPLDVDVRCTDGAAARAPPSSSIPTRNR
jgi:hypothetical protein